MSSEAARIVAHAIRKGAAQHDQNVGRRVYRGVITSLSPLGIDLLGLDMSLTADDVQFSQEVERYNRGEGLVAGDSLALNEVNDGEWIAVSVISDSRIFPVQDPTSPWPVDTRP